MAHIALAFVVFFSSSGFVLHRHFCQTELKRVSLYVPAKTCHGSARRACPHHGTTPSCHLPQPDDNCCDDQAEFHKSEQVQLVQPFELPVLNVPVFVPVAVFAASTVPALDTGFPPAHLTFKPPIVCDNIPALLQTFLL